MRRAAIIIALITGLTGCSYLMPRPVCDPGVQACDQVWVLVTGPRDWTAPEDYFLMVATRAWRIEREFGGGVVSIEVDSTVPVRLLRASDCTAIVSFTGLPGTAWVIRFDGRGGVQLEDWTGRGMETGPGLVEGGPICCP